MEDNKNKLLKDVEKQSGYQTQQTSVKPIVASSYPKIPSQKKETTPKQQTPTRNEYNIDLAHSMGLPESDLDPSDRYNYVNLADIPTTPTYNIQGEVAEQSAKYSDKPFKIADEDVTQSIKDETDRLTKTVQRYGLKDYEKRAESDKEFQNPQGEWLDEFSEARAKKKWFSNLGEEQRKLMEERFAKEDEAKQKAQALKQEGKDARQAEREYNRIARANRLMENKFLNPIVGKFWRKKLQSQQPQQDEQSQISQENPINIVKNNENLIKNNVNELKKQGINVDEALKNLNNPRHPELLKLLQWLQRVVIR